MKAQDLKEAEHLTSHQPGNFRYRQAQCTNSEWLTTRDICTVWRHAVFMFPTCVTVYRFSTQANFSERQPLMHIRLWGLARPCRVL
jgi:hypothetical protein